MTDPQDAILALLLAFNPPPHPNWSPEITKAWFLKAEDLASAFGVPVKLIDDLRKAGCLRATDGQEMLFKFDDVLAWLKEEAAKRGRVL